MKSALGTMVMWGGLALLAGCSHTGSGAANRNLALEGEVGALPSGWKKDATRFVPARATWGIVKEGDNSFVALTKPNHEERDIFNLLWADEAAFKDGEISVRVRADSGVIDQGGGLIWRAVDGSNYYIARYNPLETNLRVYYVKNSRRIQLGDVPNLTIPAGQWWALGVRHHADHIIVSLDGKDLIDAHDNTFPDAGGVGLWTKADAATSFDDLVVKAE